MIYTFFFPYIPPSGVSSLFAQLAQAIAERNTAKVRLVDFAHGAMARALVPGGRVELVEFERDKRIIIGPGETLVMQAEHAGKMRRQLEIHPEARMLLWQLHPYNFVPPLIPLIGQRDLWLRRPGLYRALMSHGLSPSMRNTVEFVTLAARKKSLFFYDMPSLRTTEAFLGLQVPDSILLPVPVNVPPSQVRNGRIASDVLHVAWVGRLYDFKVHILVHLIRRLLAHARASGKKVVLHVVGSGPKQALLEQFGVGADGLKLVRHGDLPAPELRKLLVEQVDVVASMGTAALEGAALGLPVILLDLAYSKVPPDYQFRWLFEAQGFDLGHTITPADCNPGADSFPAMMAVLEESYPVLARRCHDYTRQNHSLDVVTTRFLELAPQAVLTYGDVPQRLWRKSWARRLYDLARY